MTEQTTQPETPPKIRKRYFRRIICVFAITILLLLGLLLGALSNGYGQRALVKLTDRLMSDLQIANVSGSLNDGLVLEKLHYQNEAVNVMLPETRIQLDLNCLLRAEICLRDLTLNQPQINIDTSKLPPATEESAESTPMERIKLPVSVLIDNIAVNDLGLTIDKDQIDLGHFHTSATLNNATGFTLQPTSIDDLQVHLVASESTSTASQEPSKPVDWAALEQSLTPAFLANLQQITLPFDLHIPQITAQNWQFTQTSLEGTDTTPITLTSLDLSADVKGTLANIQKLTLQSSLGTLDAKGEANLSGSFPVSFHLQSAINAIKDGANLLLPQSDLSLDISGNLKDITQLSLKTSGVADAELKAQVQLNAEKMPLDLSLNIAKAAYAFEGSEPLKLQDVALNVNGNLLDYQTSLKGNVAGMGSIPSTQVTLQAQGKLYQVQIQQLALAALEGNADLSGLLSWRDGFTWDTKANLTKLSLRPYVPAMPAVLSGTLISQGTVDANAWQVLVPQVDINGSLNNRALSLKGNLTLDEKTLLNVPTLVLTYGDNRVAMDGKLSAQSDFNLNIQAPNLTGLWADLSGAAQGTLKLSGNISAPNLQADLAIPHFRFQELNLTNASLKGMVNSDPLIKGNLALVVNALNYGDQAKLTDIKLIATGDEKNHQLSLSSKGEPAAANLQLHGAFNRSNGQWTGAISDLKVSSPVGAFSTNKAISINYDNTKVQAQIGAHCWLNTNIELCFPENFTAGANGAVPFDIKRINLQLVNDLLKEETFKGQLRSQGRVAWFADKPLQLKLSLDGDNLAVAQKLDYRTFKLAIPKISLNTNIENNNLALQSNIQIQDRGLIKSDIKINDLAKSRQLAGSLNIEGVQLALANQLLSNNEKISGYITANLNLAGDLQKPLLHGNFDVREIKSNMRSLPFKLREGNLALRFNGTESTLNGQIATDEGSLNLTGRASWPTLANWTAEVRAQADKFKLDIPAMAKLQLTEDVVVKATPKLLELSGNIDIPWARIAIESLPDSAEPVSEDEVILNGPNKSKPELINREFAATTQSGMEIRSDLKIKIGDDVKLDAYGLKTKLAGLLSVKQEKGRLGLYGQINLDHGRYASFGQDLLIRKGQISFSGMPSQPMLNIEAIRNPEAMEDSNVVAGIKVIGVATNPEVTVFSEPSTSQDQALSYLLTGRSLENSGEAGSGGSVGAALLGMGLAKSGKLVGNIGETFGISDLNLGTAGVGESSKVVVSGNLTNRLQIKYGVGLFNGLAEVTLRYRLMPRLYFQAVSSTNQVFDLLYQFEF